MIQPKKLSVAGFTLIEIVIAISIVMLGALGTVSMLSFNHIQNGLEQERNRAHQIVTEEMERVRSQHFPHLRSASRTVTIWNNSTPDNVSDDSTGTLSVELRDPANGALMPTAPVPAREVLLEVTMTWNPRGSLGDKTYRESVMTSIAP